MKTRGLSGVARAGVLLLVGSGLVCEAGRVLGRDHGAGPSVRGMPQGLPRRLLGAAQSEAYYTSCAPGPGPVVAMSSPANPGGVTVVGGPPYDPSAINFANGVSTGSQSPASLAGPAQGQCSAGWNAAWVAARLPLPGFDPWPPTRTIHPLTIADLPPNPQIDCGPNVLVPAVAGCLRGPTPECCATLQVLFSEETRLPSRNCLCETPAAMVASLCLPRSPYMCWSRVLLGLHGHHHVMTTMTHHRLAYPPCDAMRVTLTLTTSIAVLAISIAFRHAWRVVCVDAYLGSSAFLRCPSGGPAGVPSRRVTEHQPHCRVGGVLCHLPSRLLLVYATRRHVPSLTRRPSATQRFPVG